MFTGLIETVGIIHSVDQNDSGSRIVIAVPDTSFLQDVSLGDSIAIDGACTTAIEINKAAKDTSFTIEASPETLSKTTFKHFEPGRRVNLERPLLPSSRLGGHFVTGHVDGTANVLAKYQEGNSWIYKFLLDQPEMAAYFIPKGSVAINGISLTVNTVDKATFTVAIIPHTLEHTNIADYSPNGDQFFDTVNIECDMIGKYVHRMLTNSLGQGQAADARLADKGKFFAGPWFNHDADIHGDYQGSDPREVLHWPGKPE